MWLCGSMYMLTSSPLLTFRYEETNSAVLSQNDEFNYIINKKAILSVVGPLRKENLHA